MTDRIATRIVASGNQAVLRQFFDFMRHDFTLDAVVPQPTLDFDGPHGPPDRPADAAVRAFLFQHGVTEDTPHTKYPDPGRKLLQAFRLAPVDGPSGPDDRIGFDAAGSLTPLSRKLWEAHARRILRERRASVRDGEALLRRIAAYGDMTLENWRLRHWGCPSDIDVPSTLPYRSMDEAGAVVFTRDHPPAAAMGVLTSLWPALDFRIDYTGEAYGEHTGRIVTSGGKAWQVPLPWSEQAVDLSLSILSPLPWT